MSYILRVIIDRIKRLCIMPYNVTSRDDNYENILINATMKKMEEGCVNDSVFTDLSFNILVSKEL
jgi:hypothetical protein